MVESPRASVDAPGTRTERRLRIAFCIDNMQVGGTELNAVRTAERLDRGRYDLRVISLQSEGPLVERYAAAGIPVVPFPISSLYSVSTLRQGYRLAQYLRAQRIDVFHAHDIYSNVFGVPWARLAGARVIASRRWWEGFPGTAWRAATVSAYRLAHVVLANSASVGRLVHEEGVAHERIAVIPNFVDEDAFDIPPPAARRRLRERFGIAENDVALGIVANLLPIKEHAVLLRAFTSIQGMMPALRLVLVGDGPLRTPLEALAHELGIADRVTFAGRLPNKPNLHHAFDVSVLCSRSEGLSNSILEAMAAARPVVATDVGASRDAVLDGVTGRLVPAADPGALARALCDVVGDRHSAARMGELGRERARHTFSPESAVTALEDLYQRLVCGSHHRAAVN